MVMKLINIAARVTTTRTWHTHTACLVRSRLGFVLLPCPTFLCLSLVIKFMHRRRMPRVLRKLHSSLQFAVCCLSFAVCHLARQLASACTVLSLNRTEAPVWAHFLLTCFSFELILFSYVCISINWWTCHNLVKSVTRLCTISKGN